MRKRVKFLSVILSIIIVLVSFSSTYFVSYALTPEEFIGETSWKNMSTFQKCSYLVSFVITSAGAVVGGDFASFLQGQDAFVEYMNRDPEEVIDFTENGFVVPADLVALIKQALKEYAEENMGYWIMPTIDFRLLSGSSFSSNNEYQTLKNIVNEKGIVVYSKRNYGGGSINVLIPDIYSHDIPMVYICTSSSYDPSAIANSYGCPTAFYGADTWTILSSTCYSRKVDEIYTTYDEYKSGAGISNISGEREISDFYTNASSMVHTSSGKHRFYLVSKDGRRVQVFKSLDAYKNHDTGTRRVYFGSKFYEDTGAVTGSYDDLINWLDGKYDDLWDRIGDLIGDDTRLSEDELEKIIDQLLDQLDEIGDKIDEGNQQTNNLLQQILNALNNLDSTMASALSDISFDTSVIENYLDRILGDLDHISAKLDEITYEEAEEKTDSFLSALTSAFSEIVNVGKTKFPLSLPWDVYNILNIFSGGSESVAVYENFSMEYSADEGIMLFSEDGNRLDADDVLSALDFSDSSPPVSLYGHEETPDNPIRPPGSNSKAPRFEIPFKIVSWGVDETLVIDLYKFEVISQLSRTLLTAYFVFGLIKLTFTVVGFGNEVFK